MDTPMRADQLHDLIESIYGAVSEDAATWGSILVSIASQVDAIVGTLQITDQAMAETQIYAQIGTTQKTAEQYQGRYYNKDLFIIKAPSLPRLNGPKQSVLQFSEDYVGERELAASEIYNDFLRPEVGSAFHNAGGWMKLDDGRLLILGIQRDRQRGGYEEQTQRALQLLWRHITQAMRLRVQLGASTQALDMREAALDALPLAVIVLRKDRHISFRNQAAAALFAQAGGGLSDRDGLLTLSSTDANRQLAQLVAGATGDVGPLEGAVLAPRPGERRPLTLSVAPFLPTRRHHEEGVIPLALVLITDPDAVPRGLGARAATLYGLTRAEARLAEQLVQGISPEECAALNGVRISTVRSQLQAVFHKTGAANQGALLRLLLSLPHPSPV
jgi:DNA-binding CsgD family transcriptional regulator